MREHRKDVRVIAFIRTEISYKKKFYVGYIVNLSISGCAFAHENLTDIDEKKIVKIKFRIKGKLFRQEATVVWRDSTIMGIRFKKMSDDTKRILKEYIRTTTLMRVPI